MIADNLQMAGIANIQVEMWKDFLPNDKGRRWFFRIVVGNEFLVIGVRLTSVLYGE